MTANSHVYCCMHSSIVLSIGRQFDVVHFDFLLFLSKSKSIASVVLLRPPLLPRRVPLCAVAFWQDRTSIKIESNRHLPASFSSRRHHRARALWQDRLGRLHVPFAKFYRRARKFSYHIVGEKSDKQTDFSPFILLIDTA